MKFSNMYKYLNLVFLLIFVCVQAQNPRKRLYLDELEVNKNYGDLPCGAGICVKRASGQDEMGPFWANRGKRNPTYTNEPLYVPEPYWLLMSKEFPQGEPFFTSRGKKDVREGRFFNGDLRLRDRRDFMDDVDSPFFAARGKKANVKNDRL